MSRGQRAAGWRRAAVGLCVLALAGMGCSPTSLWFLMRGDDKRQPEVPLPAKDGKKEVTVAILTTAAPGVGLEFVGADRDLAGLIAKKLADETKDDRRPIKVVDQAKVDKLKAAPGPDWRTVNPAAVGKQLGADYVLDLTLTAMSMYQPEFGREFYEGRASLNVVVYDTAAPDKPYQDYVHNGFGDQKSTAAVNPAGYRRYFVDRVATQIAHRHIPHVAVRELPPAR